MTNGHLGDLQGLSLNRELRSKYETINTITSDEASKCKSMGKIKAKDNALDSGEKYAVLYLKAEALDLKSDSVVIEKIEKVGDYGHLALGEAFKCL
jgi:hypothetical protein